MTYDNITVTVDDANTLLPKNWLNDVVIMFYMEHLKHEVFGNNPRIHFVPPVVALAMKAGDNFSIFAQEIDFENVQLVIFPLTDAGADNLSTHWYLLVYYAMENRFVYYDSKYTAMSVYTNKIQEFCERILRHTNAKSKEKPLIIYAKCATQVGSYDCGIHLCINAQNVVQNFIQNKISDTVPFPTISEIANKRVEIRQIIYDLASTTSTNLEPTTNGRSKNDTTARKSTSTSPPITHAPKNGNYFSSFHLPGYFVTLFN